MQILAFSLSYERWLWLHQTPFQWKYKFFYSERTTLEIDHSFWSLSLCSQGDLLRFSKKPFKKVLEAKVLPLPPQKSLLRDTKWSIVTTWVILSKIGANHPDRLVSLFHLMLISSVYSLVCAKTYTSKQPSSICCLKLYFANVRWKWPKISKLYPKTLYFSKLQ